RTWVWRAAHRVACWPASPAPQSRQPATTAPGPTREVFPTTETGQPAPRPPIAWATCPERGQLRSRTHPTAKAIRRESWGRRSLLTRLSQSNLDLVPDGSLRRTQRAARQLEH